ncbi:hypothetical protein, conserved [Entamoeba dispar SAW760]|uniref:Leucine rich repeat containing protein BspA family protein n=1 Tax=Entamoeba dispar (strain ATCC PRA-260 / SAW760) TaxID=370354 RepID=B0E7F7_ENTDS|nr:uncharacterized protein EDI_119680 [Entamoeba dispar SAW760]EDR29528.1 hypothetical protein, conserved [Entamoeba dispar SAW760]|eukprot:EDR29528.1 hypothetical protein, conserved [Entamoeba dispar SAW760]
MSQLTTQELIKVVDYFETFEDFKKLILCNKKIAKLMNEITLSPFHLPVEYLKFFPHLTKQQINKPELEKIPGMKEYIILYPVSFHKYHKHSCNKQLYYTKIEFTSEEQKEFGASIPSECTSINDNCFNNSDITEITLPRNIKHISLNSFLHCTQLKNIYVTSSKIFYPRVSYLMSKLITQTNGIICNDIVFTLEDRIHSTLSNGKITNIAFIPKGIQEIGQSCFENCPQYEKVSIPQTVGFIHNNAFTGCLFLQTITLPNSLLSIDDFAFSNCVSLKEIILPSFLSKLGKMPFLVVLH